MTKGRITAITDPRFLWSAKHSKKDNFASPLGIVWRRLMAAGRLPSRKAVQLVSLSARCLVLSEWHCLLKTGLVFFLHIFSQFDTFSYTLLTSTLLYITDFCCYWQFALIILHTSAAEASNYLWSAPFGLWKSRPSNSHSLLDKVFFHETDWNISNDGVITAHFL